MSARRSARGCAALLAALLLGAACEEKRFEPPDRAARVAEADSIYSPALFDTIAWAAEEDRIFLGNEVFGAHCRRCHGPLGEGGTDYAQQRGFDVPSLVDPAWEYGEDVDAVRRRIFTGHPAGMPTWGVAGITAREIDAVAHYIVFQLRPEALGTPPPAPQP